MDKQSVLNHIRALEQKHREQDEGLEILLQPLKFSLAEHISERPCFLDGG
jgi:hypothetical protein